MWVLGTHLSFQPLPPFPHGFWGSNLSCQALALMLLSPKPLCRPDTCILVLLLVW